MSDLDALRKRLTERTANYRWPCVCAPDRAPCDYHEGVEDGVDKVLALLVPAGVGWGGSPYTGETWPLYRIAADTTTEEA